MIEIKEIEKLAGLARIAIDDGEKQKLQQDLESILNYVSELKNAPIVDGEAKEDCVKNVMREDNEPHNSGEFTEDILAGAPDRSGDYFKVKPIF